MRQSEFEAAAAKLTPPAAVVAASAAGWSLQDWMYIATIGYIVLQAAYLVWKWRRERRGRGD